MPRGLNSKLAKKASKTVARALRNNTNPNWGHDKDKQMNGRLQAQQTANTPLITAARAHIGLINPLVTS